MDVIKYRDLTDELIEKFTETFVTAFQRNEFIYTYLMEDNPKTLRKYLQMIVEYNNHFADYYALINEDGAWAGAAIYLPIGCEPLGIASAYKRKKIGRVLRLFATQPIKCIWRAVKFSNLEEENWYKEEFVTLDIVGSLVAGGGKELIEKTMRNYDGKNVALNSSVCSRDNTYYEQFGFVTYKEIILDKYKTVMMIRKK